MGELAERTDGQRIMETLDKALALAKQGKLGFYSSSNAGTFHVRLIGAGDPKKAKLDVFGYFWYLNERVMKNKKLPPKEKKEIYRIIGEINGLLEEALADSYRTTVETLRTEIRERCDLGEKEMRKTLDLGCLTRLEKFYTTVESGFFRGRTPGDEEIEGVRQFLKNPKKYGPLAVKWRDELLKVVRDKGGRIATAAGSLPAWDRAQIVFTDAEKKEIEAWVKRGKPIKLDTYKKVLHLAKVMTTEAAKKVLDSVSPLNGISLAVRRVGMNADVYNLRNAESWIRWSYEMTGLKVPKKIVRR